MDGAYAEDEVGSLTNITASPAFADRLTQNTLDEGYKGQMVRYTAARFEEIGK